jgi:hypothetical protein
MIPKRNPYNPMRDDPLLKGKSSEPDVTAMLAEENQRLRKAGARLARRAMYVIAEHDGLHRLSLAVAEWAKVMGDEHNRGDGKLSPELLEMLDGED